jgi:hypothetical protein
MFNFWNSRRTKYLIDIAYCPSNLKPQTSNNHSILPATTTFKRFQSLRLK